MSLIDHILENERYTLIEGVSYEINDFWSTEEEVKEFHCVGNSSTNRFEINITLKKFSLQLAEELFQNFDRFISYRTYSLFQRVSKSDLVEYTLYSKGSGDLAFVCEISFRS